MAVRALLVTWFSVVGLVLFCGPGIAQDPPATHGVIDRQMVRELSATTDVTDLDPSRFRPVLSNNDRVHLVIWLGDDRTGCVTLYTPSSWSAKKVLDTTTDLAHCLGPRLIDRVVKTGDATVCAGVSMEAASVHSGLRLQTRLDWPAIFERLREAGASQVEIRLRVTGEPGAPPDPTLHWERIPTPWHSGYATLVSTAAASRPATLQFGLSNSAIRGGALAVGLILLLPLLVVLALRSRALRRPEDAGAFVLYARVARVALFAPTPVWIVLLFNAIDTVALFLVSIAGLGALTRGVVVPLFLVPPILTAVTVAVVSYDVQRAFRDIRYSRRGYVGLCLLPLLAFSVIAADVLVVILFPEATSGSGLLSFLRAFAFVAVLFTPALVFLLPAVRALFPYSVRSGELFDGAQAISRKAGRQFVPLTIAPAELGRIAHVMLEDRSLTVTDYLVRRMDRDEMECAITHVLAHGRLGHSWRRIFTWGLGFALSGLLAVLWHFTGLYRTAAANLVWVFLTIPVLLLIPLLRRQETEADAEAARITGNPRAYIRMLWKVARLNFHLTEPGPLGRILSTHPSTTERVAAVGADAGLSKAEIAEEVASASRSARETLGADLPQIGYPVPARPGTPGLDASADRAFTRENWRKAFWVPLAALHAWAFVVAVVIGGAAHAFGPAWAKADPDGGAPPGLVGFFIVFIAGIPYMHLAMMRRFRRRIQPKVERQYGQDLSAAQHVGLSPGDGFRLYDREMTWDAGFLTIQPGRLRYLGDACGFDLQPDQIVSTEIRKYGLAGLGMGPRLFIAWRPNADDPPQTLSLEVRDARTIGGVWRLIRGLKDEIDNWSKEPGPIPTDEPLGLPPGEDQAPGRVIGRLKGRRSMLSMALLMLLLLCSLPFAAPSCSQLLFKNDITTQIVFVLSGFLAGYVLPIAGLLWLLHDFLKRARAESGESSSERGKPC